MTLRVKICGMRDPDNIMEIAKLRPDYMGFIFYPPSPRYCGDMEPGCVRSLPNGITPVAVTVDMSLNEVLSLVERYGFKAVQLHGNESPDYCHYIRQRGAKVIKAISVGDDISVVSDMADRYKGAVDLFVLDTLSPSKGGSGRKFDWEMLKDMDMPCDYLLSGGISPGDAIAIKQLRLPVLTGVDLNSRFETSPGIKSTDLLKKFIHQL